MAKPTIKPSPAAKKPLAQTAPQTNSLATWLAPSYLSPVSLASSYQTAAPFPHIVLPGFLTSARAEALRAAVLALEKKGAFVHKESDLFSLAQTHDLKTEERGAIADLVRFFRSPEWTTYLSTVTGTKISGKELDIGGSLYTSTDYLLCHDDRVTGRKIAFIFYFCDDFALTDGGALVLLDSNGKKPGDIVQRYPPKFNTLAMFTVSTKSWHAVEEVLTRKKRFSINGWFH